MFQAALNALARDFDDVTRRIGTRVYCKALLTRGDGTGALIVANAPPRTIYVRRSDTRELFTCYLPPTSPIVLQDGRTEYEQIEVRIGKIADSDDLQVLDTMSLAGRESIGTTSPVENLMYQALYTALSNFSTLRARPTTTAGLDIAVDGPYFYKQPSTGSLQYFASGTVGSAVATAVGALAASKHQMGIVYLDKEAGTLGLALSTAVTAAGLLPSRSEFGVATVQAITLGATWEPIIPVYLYYQQTAVNEADFYRTLDLRAAYTSVPVTGYRDLIDTPLTIGANHQMTFSRRLTITSTLTVSGLLSIIA